MKKELIFKDEKSHKFWNIEVQENHYTVTYGKVGTSGRTQEKAFDSKQGALDEASAKIASKLKKGYQETSSSADSPSQSVSVKESQVTNEVLRPIDLGKMNISDTEHRFFVHTVTNEIKSYAVLRIGRFYRFGEAETLDYDDIGSADLKYEWSRNNETKNIISLIKKFRKNIEVKNYIEISYQKLLSDFLHLNYQKICEETQLEQFIPMRRNDDFVHIAVYKNKIVSYAGFLHKDIVNNSDDVLNHPFAFSVSDRKTLLGDTKVNLEKLIQYYKSNHYALITKKIPTTLQYAVELFTQQCEIYNKLAKTGFITEYQLSDIYGKKIRLLDTSTIEKNWVCSHPDDDYNITFIEGDLNIHSLLHKKNKLNNTLIVTGDINANFIIQSDSSGSLMVEGNLNVKEGLLDYCFNSIFCLGQRKFAYQFNETSGDFAIPLSLYVKELINEDSFDRKSLNSEKLYHYVISHKQFFKDGFDIEGIKMKREGHQNNENHPATLFEKQMKKDGYGVYNLAYAGFKELYTDDNCDWYFNDIRGKSGAYFARHDDDEIGKTKLDDPSEYGIDDPVTPIELSVKPLTLLEKYIPLSTLYCRSAYKTEVWLGEPEESSKQYLKDKTAFIEDPYLALYWLNHFGATLDPRYDDVVAIIENNNLVAKLDLLKQPLAFFEKNDAFYDMKIESKYPDHDDEDDDYEGLFLKRRAYLVFVEHSYENYKPENLDLWWKSILIYPKLDKNLIVRMRWLKNNLDKCNNWSDFESLLNEEHNNIPLISYVFACNPNTPAVERTQHANHLLNELLTHKKKINKDFAGTFIWDIRAIASDEKALKKASDFFFKGREIDDEYQDIQDAIAEKNAPDVSALKQSKQSMASNVQGEDINSKGTQKVLVADANKDILNTTKAAISRLNEVFSGYDELYEKLYRTPYLQESDKAAYLIEQTSYFQAVDLVLSELSDDVLLKTVTNVTGEKLIKRCFAYLWHADIADKKEALIHLFINEEGIRIYDVNPRRYGGSFSALIKSPDDPNIEIVKAFITIPEADFRNDYIWEISKERAVEFFLNAAHYPNVFNYLMETVKQKPTDDNEHIIEAIYSVLLSKDYGTKVNSTLLFSKNQMETMLENAYASLIANSHNDSVENCIYYCANPLAESWLKQRITLSPETFFLSALEFIDCEKHNAHLELKEDTSHQYWKISFYENAYTIVSGDVDKEGEELRTEFETKELCYLAGDKLTLAMLEKGYTKVNS